jgi:hypothetical protein
MLTNRTQGQVKIEVTISASGCVADAKVTRSVAIPLDLAALRAVLRWRDGCSRHHLRAEPLPCSTKACAIFNATPNVSA